MSTTTKIALALEIAERFMAESGYSHGLCLGAKKREPATSDHWEVEFAYDGLVDRSPTADPPSILLLVDLEREDVRPIDLM